MFQEGYEVRRTYLVQPVERCFKKEEGYEVRRAYLVQPVERCSKKVIKCLELILYSMLRGVPTRL